MSLDYFPIFINMNQKQAVVFGGGTIASRRAKALLEFGAKVQIVAPEISEDLQMGGRGRKSDFGIPQVSARGAAKVSQGRFGSGGYR